MADSVTDLNASLSRQPAAPLRYEDIAARFHAPDPDEEIEQKAPLSETERDELREKVDYFCRNNRKSPFSNVQFWELFRDAFNEGMLNEAEKLLRFSPLSTDSLIDFLDDAVEREHFSVFPLFRNLRGSFRLFSGHCGQATLRCRQCLLLSV